MNWFAAIIAEIVTRIIMNWIIMLEKNILMIAPPNLQIWNNPQVNISDIKNMSLKSLADISTYKTKISLG